MSVPVQAAADDAAGRFCHRVLIAAPPAGQLHDVVEGFEVKRSGTFLQYPIA